VAQVARSILHGQVTAALGVCDVLLSPTMPTTAPLLDGHLATEDMADPLAAPHTDCCGSPRALEGAGIDG
jgi:aspartyl-tRNA(Asn)/glutamyl-tRNA(Gln) amidotransferase subunit A